MIFKIQCFDWGQKWRLDKGGNLLRVKLHSDTFQWISESDLVPCSLVQK